MQVIFGECLGASLEPAYYIFRDVRGRTLFRVSEESHRGLLQFTKLRGLTRLTLRWEPGSFPFGLWMHRYPHFWRSHWELTDASHSPLLRFTPAGFAARWDIEDLRTGASVTAGVRNPLIFGPQSGELQIPGGPPVAKLQWEDFSWRLFAHLRVRVEVMQEGWVLAALALAVVRWVSMQQR